MDYLWCKWLLRFFAIAVFVFLATTCVNTLLGENPLKCKGALGCVLYDETNWASSLSPPDFAHGHQHGFYDLGAVFSERTIQHTIGSNIYEVNSVPFLSVAKIAGTNIIYTNGCHAIQFLKLV